MDPQDLMLTALRASLIYFFLLFVVRILGKREVGNTSAFDLIVALMLGEVVDEAIYGDVSMAKGMLAIGVIAVWHLINSWASYRNKTVQRAFISWRFSDYRASAASTASHHSTSSLP